MAVSWDSMNRQITESRRMPSASSRSNRPITGVLRLSGMLPQSSDLIWSSRKRMRVKVEMNMRMEKLKWKLRMPS